MVEEYFSARTTRQRMQSGPCGAYLDGFVESLERDGYTPTSIRRSLRAATHLGVFLMRRRQSVADLDAATLAAFGRHLLQCRCRPSSGRRTGYHARFGAQRFHAYLITRGVCRRPSGGEPLIPSVPSLVVAFTAWYQTHRGATAPTLRHYRRGATAMLDALGPDVGAWTPQAVRQFLLTPLRDGRPASTQQLITATRAFVRYLAFRGEARADLAVAIPAIARWRLASLPRYLTPNQLAQVLAACEGDAPARVRDRAIVLLLARLGLRAGDVLHLRLGDLEWEQGTIRVTGKGRYQVRLPLPQEVGEAVARYLACRPPRPETDRVFLSTIAPIGPLRSIDAVPSIVARVLARAGVQVARPGAHILRHTAATEMLRHGVSLDHIGLVLRHRSLDVSAYYAKVDVTTLRQVAQPWPGRRS